jgi:hypothetical protein
LATSYKAGAVERMLTEDSSGRLRRLHDQLVSLGLKTKLPRNTETLLFEAVTSEGERVGLAAIRGGITEVLSFPRPYWLRHVQQLDASLSAIHPRHFIQTEGFVSSSQYSLRQVRVSGDTVEQLSVIVGALVRAHANELAGAA